MIAHVLLNLLNELGKRDKMRGLPSILSLFRNEFNKFNNTRARMLKFFLSYDIKITLKYHFSRKYIIILSLCTQSCYRRHNVSKIDKPLVVYRFHCMALFHSQTRRHMKIKVRQPLSLSLSLSLSLCRLIAKLVRTPSTTFKTRNNHKNPSTTRAKMNSE